MTTLWKIIVLVLSIAGITLLHYTTGTHQHFYHDIYQRLYYLPIIFSAFWFGLRGGLAASVVISVLYAFHIVFQLGAMPSTEIERFLEILLYNVVGGVTGYLAERERKLRVMHQEAAERLSESYRRLEEQTGRVLEIEEQLRRADRLSTLGELAAGMAHELRNPLSSIKGTAEILQGDYKPGDRKYEFIGIMVKEVERLNRVVEEFLRFARPLPLQPTDVDLGEEISSVTHLLKGQAANIAMDIIPFSIPKIKADREKLVQVFLNIVLNAIQAMPNGGRLTITASVSNGFVELSFRDTGPGIPEENRDRLFKPFFTTKSAGTGLGLAISNRIVEAHGGKITFESKVGMGTTFRVRLPAITSKSQ